MIVPVIKGADNLSLLAMARTVNDLANRARTKKLQPDEVKGGTFTLTNHGISGSLLAFPVINQPQSGILGVGAMQKRVVVIDDAIAIRPMVYLSFVFDHRILDGASAELVPDEGQGNIGKLELSMSFRTKAKPSRVQSGDFWRRYISQIRANHDQL